MKNPPACRAFTFRSTCLIATALALASFTPLTWAIERSPQAAEGEAADPSEKAPGPRRQKIENWGSALDLAGDCQFKLTDGTLSIEVPGGRKPHDMSTELESSTAPRVLQPARGDFKIEVKIDGEFAPGGESTQRGRSGYTGAGLIVFADAKNYVRLERATLQYEGKDPKPYTNFEIRVDGEVQRIGVTSDLPTEGGKPTWLRLERQGNLLRGFMSQDGVNWKEGEPKELVAAAWRNDVLVGVAAISTSRQAFIPQYSALSVQSNWTPPKDDAPAEVEKPDAPAK